jgi:hypothetical protein
VTWDAVEEFFRAKGDAAAVESVRRKRRLARDRDPPDSCGKGNPGHSHLEWNGPPRRYERVGTVTTD